MLKSILHPAHEARSVLVKKKDSLSWTTNPDQHIGKSQQTNYCAITAPHSLASMYSIHHTTLLINTQVYLHLNASKCHTRKWQNKTNPSICKKHKNIKGYSQTMTQRYFSASLLQSAWKVLQIITFIFSVNYIHSQKQGKVCMCVSAHACVMECVHLCIHHKI